MSTHRTPFLLEELNRKIESVAEPEEQKSRLLNMKANFLGSNGSHLCVPVHGAERFWGYFTLTKKPGESTYTTDELEGLSHVASQTAQALNAIRMHQLLAAEEKQIEETRRILSCVGNLADHLLSRRA